MLKEDRIHLLGSDCHNLSLRPPNLGQAIELIEKHLGSDVLLTIEEYQDILLQTD
jgi:protein-tyrosine phosphatase